MTLQTDLVFEKQNDLIFIDKPAGFSTHAADPHIPGIHEIYSQKIQQKLWVTHRLDKTTTGSLCFATSEDKARELFQAFAEHRVRKKYLFVTDRKSTFLEKEFSSFIEKRGKIFVSEESPTPNAKTVFKRVKGSPFFELWEAYPESGKPHQIRLHASQIGLPICGDELYGGTRFPHLCLHSAELEIPGTKTWATPPPLFFERLGLLKDPALVRLLSEMDRRQRLFGFLQKPEQCFRLIHQNDLTIDKLGSVLWVAWYKETPPTAMDLQRFDFLGDLTQTSVIVRQMENRGKNPNSQSLWHLGRERTEEAQNSWQAKENNTIYEFRSSSGLSSGLFLDQRDHRQKVRALAKEKKILNLFSYTCGFSVEAALGGATEVTSVDVSNNTLEWAKQNFSLNHLDPSKYEFFSSDCLVYLKGAAKRQRQFDLIICDPPSFGRAGKSVFRLEKELDSLLGLCGQCLHRGGVLLFTCNYEKWNQIDFETRVKKALPHQRIETGQSGWDYELPSEQRKLKALWVFF